MGKTYTCLKRGFRNAKEKRH